MNILIAGGTGFIGRMLVPTLLGLNNELTVVGRDKTNIIKVFPEKVQAVDWNNLSLLDPEKFDAIINLAGANIAAKKWNDKVKAELISSRVDSVLKLVEWCKRSNGRKPHLYNASAIGYYGLQTVVPEKPLFATETSDLSPRADHSFSRQLVLEWEAATQSAASENIPVTIMRFGVVLRRGEGMLKQLELPARFGMSALLGTGQQPISWISSVDVINAIVFLLAHPAITGPVNLVAPEVVTQQYFSRTLATVLKRPALLRMPAWMVRLLFGQMGEELLLSGQAVLSEQLLNQQFQFAYSTLLAALEHEFSSEK